ncbi:MAG: efflux RND transporter periplasmic adaptor subunit [Hyphomicrobiales bacterium]|nr:efflux RND transporter periplasmic adaptor subunit [Hyphomicrobiales bacterium]
MTTRKLLFGAAMIAAAGIVAVYDPTMLGLKSAFQTAHAAGEKKSAGHGKDDGHGHGGGEEEHAEEGAVKVSAAQIEAAKIEVTTVDGGVLATRIAVPGAVTLDSDRISRVAAKVSGTVSELRKRLGDIVVKDEVIAVLESREVAEAKGEYLSALVTEQLQTVSMDRHQRLWEQKIARELEYLQVKSAYTEARVKSELARQKLLAFNVREREIKAVVPSEIAIKPVSTETVLALRPSDAPLSRHEIRSPIEGRIIERKVDRGAAVGQETELFVIADLSVVNVELGVATADLNAIKQGQKVLIKSTDANKGTAAVKISEGKVIFINPIIDRETRSARVLVSLENKDLTWRPGSFVTAEIIVEEQSIEVGIPLSAIQKIENQTVVFVRTDEGFEKREVVIGKKDAHRAEIVFGLDPGEKVASTNVFTLKADLGKSEAEHSH